MDRRTPIDAAEEVLAEVLALREGDPALDVAAWLETHHPALADAVRERLEVLDRLDLDDRAPAGDGRVIGDFRLIEGIGHGGMGEVWLAEQMSLGRLVALKLLRSPAPMPATLALRFDREARALAALGHDNVVGVFAAGRVDDTRFIAMEYLEGRSLDEIAADAERPSVREAVTWIRDVARGLAAAHEHGIIHRDVKPSNIRVTPSGRAVLIDFGLTRGVGADSLSVTGSFVGSPHYASPEQIGGRRDDVGPATDVYSLGVTLFELLGGRPPFEGATSAELFHAILVGDPPPIRRLNPGVSRELGTVVMRAMAPRPRDRYRTITALADDLDAILELRPVSVRPPGPVARVRRLARRHPATTLAAATVAGLLVVIAAADAWSARRERAEREHAARRELDGASALLDELLGDVATLPERMAVFVHEDRRLANSHNERSVVRAHDEEQRRLEALRSRGEAGLDEILRRARRSEELGGDRHAIATLRARVYLQRYRLADAEGDRVLAEHYAARVRESDPGGVAARLGPTVSVGITTTPPGARVLRVASDRAPFLAGDLIVELADAEPWGAFVGEHAGPLRRGDRVNAIGGALTPTSKASSMRSISSRTAASRLGVAACASPDSSSASPTREPSPAG